MRGRAALPCVGALVRPLRGDACDLAPVFLVAALTARSRVGRREPARGRGDALVQSHVVALGARAGRCRAAGLTTLLRRLWDSSPRCRGACAPCRARALAASTRWLFRWLLSLLVSVSSQICSCWVPAAAGDVDPPSVPMGGRRRRQDWLRRAPLVGCGILSCPSWTSPRRCLTSAANARADARQRAWQSFSLTSGDFLVGMGRRRKADAESHTTAEARLAVCVNAFQLRHQKKKKSMPGVRRRARRGRARAPACRDRLQRPIRATASQAAAAPARAPWPGGGPVTLFHGYRALRARCAGSNPARLGPQLAAA
jgi:hypothetical protein